MKLTDCTDEELIKKFTREKNSEAFAVLIDRHRQNIRSEIKSQILDESLAEDLAQDTLIKIFVALQAGKYKEQGTLRTWMLIVARHVVTDHFRVAKRRPQFLELFDIDYEEMIDDDRFPFALLFEESPETMLLQKEFCLHVLQMIPFLPKEQRRLIKMRFFQGKPFREIARMMNSNISTTLARQRYALRNLRKLLSKEPEKVLISA